MGYYKNIKCHNICLQRVYHVIPHMPPLLLLKSQVLQVSFTKSNDFKLYDIQGND